jgi:hypothetical protein
VTYESYWKGKILDLLKDSSPVSSGKSKDEEENSTGVSIADIVKATGMLESDIRETLDKLDLLKMQDGEVIIEVPQAMMEKHLEKQKQEQKLFEDPNSIQVRPCDPTKLIWSPFLLPAKKKRKVG